MSLFSLRSPIDLAAALTGRQLELPSGMVVELTKVDPYHRTDNDTPTYRSMFDMHPGEIFTPNVMGSRMFLVVCYDGQQVGACVRISGISGPTGIITGAGRVGAFIGFSHRQTGRIVEREGMPLLLQVDGALNAQATTPVVPSKNGAGKAKGGILPSSVVGRYLEALTAKYKASAQETDNFNNWLDRVRAEHNTEAKLKRFLAE